MYQEDGAVWAGVQTLQICFWLPDCKGSEGEKGGYLENSVVELDPGLDSEGPKFVKVFGSGVLAQAHH